MNKFPLSRTPYYSRNSQFLEQRNISEGTDPQDSVFKNYVYHTFTPGNPLQAQELNEIQERWQNQLTLSNNFLQYYISNSSGNSDQISFISSTGVILSPNIQAFAFSSPLSATITIIGDSESYASVYDNGMRYWITLPTLTITVNMSSSNVRYVKLNTQITYVSCSSSVDDEGFYFNDNSSGTYISGTCGAGRVKVQAISLSESSSANETNLIFRVEKDSNNGNVKVYDIGTGKIIGADGGQS